MPHKKLRTIIASLLVLGATPIVPIIPEKIEHVASYETALFDTDNGDLAVGQYASDGTNTFYRDAKDGQFKAVGDEPVDLASYQQVNVAGKAYYHEFVDDKGKVSRFKVGQDDYLELKDKKGKFERTKLETLWDASFAKAASPTFSAATNQTGAAASSLTYAVTVADVKDRLMAVSIAAEDTALDDLIVSTITYAGKSCTFIARELVGTNGNAELWYCLNPTVGSANLVVTFVGTTSGFGVSAITFRDMRQQGQPSNFATAEINGSTSTMSTTLLSRGYGCYMVDAIYSSTSGPTCTVDAGQKERADQTDGAAVRHCASSKYVFAPGSTTLGWTFSSATSKASQVVACFVPNHMGEIIED